jgi:hypothetical protein
MNNALEKCRGKWSCTILRYYSRRPDSRSPNRDLNPRLPNNKQDSTAEFGRKSCAQSDMCDAHVHCQATAR